MPSAKYKPTAEQIAARDAKRERVRRSCSDAPEAIDLRTAANAVRFHVSKVQADFYAPKIAAAI